MQNPQRKNGIAVLTVSRFVVTRVSP